MTIGSDIHENWLEVLTMSMALPDRPKSFAAMLDGLAAWLDHADRTLVKRGEKKALSDGTVQADLRRVARALREDPNLDDLMMDAVLHGPAEEA